MDHEIIDLCDSDEETAENNAETAEGSSHADGSDAEENDEFLAKCHKCFESFGTIDFFIEHMKNVHGFKDLVKCRFCDLVFSNKNALRSHVKSEHPDVYRSEPSVISDEDEVVPAPVITIGDETTSDPSVIKNETVSDPLDTSYSCTLCGEKFTFLESLRAHEDVHTLEKKYSVAEDHCSYSEMKKYLCSICLRPFITERALALHEERKHRFTLKKKRGPGRPRKSQTVPTNAARNSNKANPALKSCNAKLNARGLKNTLWKCSRCDETFKFKFQLTKHRECHLNVKRFSCTRCSEKFSLQSNLKLHEFDHLKNCFKCEYCGKPQNTKAALARHKYKFHEHLRKGTGVIGEFSKRKTDLRQVPKVQKSKKIAGLTSNKKAQNKVNVRKNSSKLVVSNQIFGAFKQKKWQTNVEKSIKKNLPGSECTAGTSLSQENIHVKKEQVQSKNTVKPIVLKKRFSCKICDESFSFRFDYDLHTESHKKNKRFPCYHCNESFALKISLKTHLLRHHPSGPIYFCKVCKRPFEQKRFMHLHFKNCYTSYIKVKLSGSGCVGNTDMVGELVVESSDVKPSTSESNQMNIEEEQEKRIEETHSSEVLDESSTFCLSENNSSFASQPSTSKLKQGTSEIRAEKLSSFFQHSHDQQNQSSTFLQTNNSSSFVQQPTSSSNKGSSSEGVAISNNSSNYPNPRNEQNPSITETIIQKVINSNYPSFSPNSSESNQAGPSKRIKLSNNVVHTHNEQNESSTVQMNHPSFSPTSSGSNQVSFRSNVEKSSNCGQPVSIQNNFSNSNYPSFSPNSSESNQASHSKIIKMSNNVLHTLNEQNESSTFQMNHPSFPPNSSGSNQVSFRSNVKKPSDCSQPITIQNNFSASILKNNQALKKYTDERKIETCMYCDKSFKWPHQLSKHLELHSSVKSFSCSLCSEKFSFEENLKMHFYHHLPNYNICNICELPFTTVASLKRHTKLHEASSQYQLSKQNWSRERSSQLPKNSNRVEINSSLPQSSPQIAFNPKQFSSDKSCVLPSGSHSNEKTSQQLNKNNSSPTFMDQIKMFYCNCCSFSSPYYFPFVQHMEKHDANKMLFCHICNHPFAHEISRNAHITINHFPGKVYYCSVCLEPFNQEQYMLQHSVSCYKLYKKQLQIRCAMSMMPQPTQVHSQTLPSHTSNTSSSTSQVSMSTIPQATQVHKTPPTFNPAQVSRSVIIPTHSHNLQVSNSEPNSAGVDFIPQGGYFSCNFCGRQYNKEDKLLEHLALFHPFDKIPLDADKVKNSQQKKQTVPLSSNSSERISVCSNIVSGAEEIPTIDLEDSSPEATSDCFDGLQSSNYEVPLACSDNLPVSTSSTTPNSSNNSKISSGVTTVASHNNLQASSSKVTPTDSEKLLHQIAAVHNLEVLRKEMNPGVSDNLQGNSHNTSQISPKNPQVSESEEARTVFDNLQGSSHERLPTFPENSHVSSKKVISTGSDNLRISPVYDTTLTCLKNLPASKNKPSPNDSDYFKVSSNDSAIISHKNLKVTQSEVTKRPSNSRNSERVTPTLSDGFKVASHKMISTCSDNLQPSRQGGSPVYYSNLEVSSSQELPIHSDNLEADCNEEQLGTNNLTVTSSEEIAVLCATCGKIQTYLKNSCHGNIPPCCNNFKSQSAGVSDGDENFISDNFEDTGSEEMLTQCDDLDVSNENVQMCHNSEEESYIEENLVSSNNLAAYSEENVCDEDNNPRSNDSITFSGEEIPVRSEREVSSSSDNL